MERDAYPFAIELEEAMDRLAGKDQWSRIRVGGPGCADQEQLRRCLNFAIRNNSAHLRRVA